MTYNFWIGLVIVFALIAITVFLFCNEIKKGRKVSSRIDSIFIVLIGAFYIYYIGLRNFDVGTDTLRYIRIFKNTEINSILFFLNSFTGSGIGLLFFSKGVGLLTSNAHIYLLSVSALYILLCVQFIYSFSTYNRLFLLFAFLACFFFYSMGINVLKSGIALMFVLNGISLDLKNNKAKWLCFILGFLFHASMVLIIGIWFLSKRFKNLNMAYSAWVLSVVLSSLGLGFTQLFSILQIDFVNNFIQNYGFSGYLENGNISNYNVGFRLDFTVFSGIFILFGAWVHKKIKNPIYKRIYISYIYLNAIFILAYTIPYSDRIGMISWILIPILICFPFIMSKQSIYVIRNNIFIWYAFTLAVGIFSFVLNNPW